MKKYRDKKRNLGLAFNPDEEKRTVRNYIRKVRKI